MNINRQGQPRRRRIRRVLGVGAWVMAMAGSGCFLWRGQPAPEDPDPHARMVIQATPDVNNGNVVQLGVYLLSGTAAFEGTTPEAFWPEDVALVGDELIEKQPLIRLAPDGRQVITFDVPEDTRYIGIAADFHSPDRDRWRDVIELPDVVPRLINIHVEVGRDVLTMVTR